MTCSTPQEVYAAARSMQGHPRAHQAWTIFHLGGRVTPASRCPADQYDFEETRWTLELLGLTATGDGFPATIDAWLRAAQLMHTLDPTRRATDGRADCPYNGQGLAPGHPELRQ